MAERCLKGHDECSAAPVFHFQWTENRSGLPGMGKRWDSWSCEGHSSHILRFAMAMRFRVGAVQVDAAEPASHEAAISEPHHCVFGSDCPYS